MTQGENAKAPRHHLQIYMSSISTVIMSEEDSEFDLDLSALSFPFLSHLQTVSWFLLWYLPCKFARAPVSPLALHAYFGEAQPYRISIPIFSQDLIQIVWKSTKPALSTKHQSNNVSTHPLLAALVDTCCERRRHSLRLAIKAAVPRRFSA